MEDQVIRQCQRFVQPQDSIVVAVSGGADSICLAHALQRVARNSQAQIVIAHVNHQLRDDASDCDAGFVCAWAEKYQLPRRVVRIDVQRQGGQSLQSVARDQRYKALLDICHEFDANKLAMAHHADDQVETFLLNLLRGSGGRGLQGIPQQRWLEDILLIRPLLAISRATIEEYCQQHKLDWCTDASNANLSYLRNRIRHQLLPDLRTYNSGIDEVLLNTANILQTDEELLTELSEQALSQIQVPSPLPFASQALSVAKLRRLAPALRNRVILSLLPVDVQTSHIELVLGLLDSQTGASIDLPGQRRAYRLPDSIAIGSLPHQRQLEEVRVSIPGQHKFGEWVVTVDTSGPGEKFYLPQSTGSVTIGPRKPGDYFYLPGGGKKIKDYMIDCKIPRWLRDTYPVVRVDNNIVWLVGLAQDRRFVKPGPGTRAVYINFVQGENKGHAKEYR